MIFLNSSNFTSHPFSYGEPRTAQAVPLFLDFSADTTYQLNTEGARQFSNIDRIQGIWIDNAANTSTVTITASSTTQRLIIPAQSQGYYAMLITTPTVLTFVSGGGVLVNIELINVPVVTHSWFPTVGPVVVMSDPILDSTVSGLKVNVRESTLDGAIVGGVVQTNDQTLPTVISGGKVQVQDVLLESVVSGGKFLVSDSAIEAIISGGKLAVSDALLEALISGGNLSVADAILDGTVSAGKVSVSDAALEALISGGKLAVADSILDGTVSGGKVSVADSVLDGCVTSNMLATTPNAMYTGGVIHPVLVGNLVALNNLSTSGNTSVIFTGAPGYYVTGISISIGDAVAASRSLLHVLAVDSSAGNIWQTSFTIDTTLQSSYSATTPPGWFWNNKNSNSNFRFNLSASTSSGSLRYSVSYGICSFIG
jgi:hypothetical protein